MQLKTSLTTCLLIVYTAAASAQDEKSQEEIFAPITTGANFLAISPDARGGGNGDAGAATSPDGDNQYWNPSKYAFMESKGGASISYVPWLRKIVPDVDLISAAGYYKINDIQAVAMNFRFFSFGQVLIRKDPNDPGYNVKPYDLSLDASYSRVLAKNFSMGVALRFIWSDLTGGQGVEGQYISPGWSIAADISGYYCKPVEFSYGTGYGAFGFNISNIGKKLDYGTPESSTFIPTNFRIGGRYTQPLGDKYNHMSFALDFNKLLVPSRPVQMDGESQEDYSQRLNEYYYMDPITGIFRSLGDNPNGFAGELQEFNFSLAVEYDYNNQFFGRIGYHNESKIMGDRKYMTFGAGFRLNVFSLDVAYVLAVTKQNPMDQTLRFTLGFNMGGLKQLASNTKDDSNTGSSSKGKRRKK